MGLYAIDQFSLLHFAAGIIAYFWGLSAIWTLLLHILFEWAENTKVGMKFINEQFPLWPGGKPYADSLLNQFTDTVFTMIGWYLSQLTDALSTEKHLYP
jgi:hypothetical protein